jgi:hypothetical protein
MSNVFRQFANAARQVWFQQRKIALRQRIERRLGQSQDPEIKEVVGFLRNHPELALPLHMTPPYEWVKDYRTSSVVAERDAGSGLLYATVNGHRVFFPRRATPPNVQFGVATGQMEQDPRSPHRYVGDGFNVDAGDVAVFIGASDGMFCLSLIDRLAKAYMFEPDADWHEPLRNTFAGWGGKVEIVPLAAASSDGPGRVSLDHFFQDRPAPHYIQMDVEGAELDVLNGARNLLRNAVKLRLSICTYHKRLDFPTFEQLLSGQGYTIGHSPGFYQLGVRMPYFRRGILYASRGAPPQTAAGAAGAR